MFSTRLGELRSFSLQPRRSNPTSRTLFWALGVRSTWFLNFGGQAKCKPSFSCWLLTFSCCYWSCESVVSEETWIKTTTAAYFCFFFRLHSRWSPFLLQETWWSVFKFNWLENYHEFSISNTCGAMVKKKKRKKKRKKTVHSTNEDWSWKISPSLCWIFKNWFVL